MTPIQIRTYIRSVLASLVTLIGSLIDGLLKITGVIFAFLIVSEDGLFPGIAFALLVLVISLIIGTGIKALFFRLGARIDVRTIKKHSKANSTPLRSFPVYHVLSEEKKVPERKEPVFKLGNDYYFEFDEVPNGYGGCRMVDVILLKTSDPAFRCCIVDRAGKIQNFPGIENGEWEETLQYPLDNMVRFGFWIDSYQDGKASVSWTLQPDGRYFADEDGFGAENLEEITLYSHIDEQGRFTAPFTCQS